jgi:hypothetical protein
MAADLPTPDTIADQLDELAVLWPALPAALARDAGTTSGERVTTSENVHTIPLNPDVASALHRLNAAIPSLNYLHNLATEYAGHYDNQRTTEAQQLANTIHSWLTDARHALGLNRPDRPIGEHCPQHDDPITPLVTPGDRGHLAYDHLDFHGRPVNPWIRWERQEIVTCRHCHQQWTPGQYMWLGRLIRWANNRRTPQPREDEADKPESEAA